MSGQKFRQAQLTDERLKDIPVIVFSGMHDMREQSVELTATGYAIKPLMLDRLLALIRQHCLK